MVKGNEKRERPKRRWLDKVMGKNGTQTRWHIKPSYKPSCISKNLEWRKAVNEVTIESR